MSGKRSRTHLLEAAVLFTTAVAGAGMAGPNPEVQQRFDEIKQSLAANKRALAGYTWQQQQTVSVKGEVKKQELYRVRLGPDGKPEKTLISSTPESPAAPRGGRLKRHIVEKKTEEFQQYARQVGLLAKSYAQPDPQKLQQAFERGDVKLGSSGVPGEFELIVTNYLKPNDSMHFFFNRAEHAIQRIQVSSYLTDPNDAVTMDIRFAKLPDGTNHVSGMTVNGVAKQLSIQDRNSDYVKSTIS